IDPAVGEVELQPRLLAELEGQTDGKRAAATQLALQRHFSAEQLHELLDDGQAQTGPRVLARQRIARLAELLENQFLFFGSDADTTVRHGKNEVRRFRLDFEKYATPFGCEFDRIRQQVGKNLLKLDDVLPEERQSRVDLAAQVDVLLLGEGPEHVEESL